MWEIAIYVEYGNYSKTYIIQHELITYIGELQDYVLSKNPGARIADFRNEISLALWDERIGKWVDLVNRGSSVMNFTEYQKGDTIQICDEPTLTQKEIELLLIHGFTLKE